MSAADKKWTLQGFVDHFAFVHDKMPDHKFVWMLGAGASLASGIPLGSTLVDRWLAELHVREDHNNTPLEEWATEKNLDIDGFTYEERASFYPKVYERRFNRYPEEGYADLESAMADADPSPGYSILAAALAGNLPDRQPRHNAVVTTNFDNLVADALSIYTDTFPFVCGHESLTPFVKVAMRRPVVCKIHRDLLLAPQNDSRSLRRLHDAWGMALRALFEHYTPLFIGYGGNDDTLMDLLESLQPGDIKGQLIWCYYEGGEPSERIKEVVADHKGILVPVPDFDLLMVLLGEKMGIALLDEEIGQRADARTEKYRDRIKELDTVKHPEVTQALAAIYERSGGWWAWDKKAELETDPVRREVVYRQGIRHCPQSAALHNCFGLFMTSRGDKNEEAEELFERALQIEPDDANITGNLALLVANNDNDPDRAERLFCRAIELKPESPNQIGNYAAFLLTQGRLAEAETKLNNATALLQRTDERYESTQNRYAAKITLHSEILARASGEKELALLEEVGRVIRNGFPRVYFNFANLLKFARTRVSHDDLVLYSALAEAINDKEKVPAALELIDQRLAVPVPSSKAKPKPRKKVAKKKAASKKSRRKKAAK